MSKLLSVDITSIPDDELFELLNSVSEEIKRRNNFIAIEPKKGGRGVMESISDFLGQFEIGEK